MEIAIAFKATPSAEVDMAVEFNHTIAWARAIDELAERFGPNVVKRAEKLTRPSGIRLAPTLDFLEDRTID